MSTNYYLHRNETEDGDRCPTCGHLDVATIHIGKLACGWVFVWRGYRGQTPAGRPITSPEAWLAFLAEQTSAGADIRNEEGRPVALEQFIEIVHRSTQPNARGHPPSRTSDWDRQHCLGMGDTDLSFGEFS